MNQGVISQVRIASNNPVALLVGCLLGGFVPFATYFVAHTTTLGWNLATLLVLGGLLYSAKTVYQWGRQAFSCPYKAAGFVLLIEGTMVTSNIRWLSITALCYLVAINAVATGCQLALRDKPSKATQKAPKYSQKPRQNKGRSIVTPAFSEN